MAIPKRILVATDFSEASEAALDYAVDLAKAIGAKIVVLHAYELPVYGFPDGALIATADMAATIMNGAQAGVAAMCESRASRGVELSQVVRQGIVWEEVESVADEMSVELVVVGTHGRTGIAHALLGSVAEKIIRTSTRAVLTVHGPKKAKT